MFERPAESPLRAGPLIRIPGLARAVIAFIRAVPPLVTIAFTAFALGSLLAGRPGQAARAAAMALLALVVAVRSLRGGAA